MKKTDLTLSPLAGIEVCRGRGVCVCARPTNPPPRGWAPPCCRLVLVLDMSPPSGRKSNCASSQSVRLISLSLSLWSVDPLPSPRPTPRQVKGQPAGRGFVSEERSFSHWECQTESNDSLTESIRFMDFGHFRVPSSFHNPAYSCL